MMRSESRSVGWFKAIGGLAVLIPALSLGFGCAPQEETEVEAEDIGEEMEEGAEEYGEEMEDMGEEMDEEPSMEEGIEEEGMEELPAEEGGYGGGSGYTG